MIDSLVIVAEELSILMGFIINWLADKWNRHSIGEQESYIIEAIKRIVVSTLYGAYNLFLKTFSRITPAAAICFSYTRVSIFIKDREVLLKH